MATSDPAHGAAQGGRLNALDPNYWAHAGGIPVEAAKQAARDEGFGFELGRISRFDNSRGVIIAKNSVRSGEVNRIELAEEIQHGIDRPTSEASKAISAGKSNERFHAELYGRIIENYGKGRFRFLTSNDIRALTELAKELSTR